MTKLIPRETKLKILDAVQRKVPSGTIARIHGVSQAHVCALKRKLTKEGKL